MKSVTTLVTPEIFVEQIPPSHVSQEQQQQQEQEQHDMSIIEDVVMSQAEAPATTPAPETKAGPLAPTHRSRKSAAKRKRDHAVSYDDESDGQGVTDKKALVGTQTKAECKQGTGGASEEVQGTDSSTEEVDENKKQASASSRRAKSVPANSYYTFTVVGDTLEERFDNIAKVIKMSPVKRPFSATSSLIITEHVQDQDAVVAVVEGKDSDEVPAVPPPPTGGDVQTKPVDSKGIRDILFFTTEFLGGCFTVRNRPVKQEYVTPEEDDYLQEMYDGLLDIGEKISHEKYSQLTSKLKMNLHIKSWYCVRPFYETGFVPPPDFTDKGISSYRIFDDGTGLFQFDSDHTSSTTANSAEVFGTMHKCMCMQIKGEVAQKILESKKNNVTDSFGDIIYRSKWRNDDKRPSKYLKFTPAGDSKFSNEDILSIVNTPNMFVATHFNDDTREYGVVRSKDKIVPCSIVIYNGGLLPPKEGEEEQGVNLQPIPVQFTAITQSAFSREKAKDGMNSLKASNSRRANTTATTKSGGDRKRSAPLSFDTVCSTSFTFSDIPRELVQRIASQDRVKFLKAVKNPKDGEEVVEEEVIEGGEQEQQQQQQQQQQDSFRGVVKTFTGVKAINLANRKPGKLVPADSTKMNSVLAGMKDMELEFDIERASKTPASCCQHRQGGDMQQ